MTYKLTLSLVIFLGVMGCGGGEPRPSVGAATSAPQGVATGDVGARLNAVRAKRGLAQVSRSGALTRAAQDHARDMSTKGYFSHTSPEGGTLVDRVTAAGYPYCFVAENIAQGQQSAAEVMTAWMNSPGHRRNNLSKRATEYGVARADGNYWVLVLGSGC